MQAIYDSIHSAVAGEGTQSSFYTMSHLGLAIQGVDESNADMYFSVLSNYAPPLDTVYESGGQMLSDVYGSIVNNAEPTGSILPPQFNEAKEKYKDASGNNFPAQAFPPNWWSTQTPFESISIDSNDLHTDDKSFWTRVDGKTKFDLGIFSTKADVEGKVHYTKLSTETKNLKLQTEIAGIQVIRSWYDGQILSLNDWKVPGVSRNGYSTGKIESSNKGSFPLLTTKAVLIRNLSIIADWGDEQTKTIDADLKASVEFGLGPFKFKGTVDIGPYHKKTYNSTFEHGELKTPKDITYLQGFVCEIIPACPPKGD
ncbi:MAG: hypothetical protein SVJ22_11685 [Halobacteriota archaeon]|nr:hypothetical protein [Halobacteriota archaeon]